MSEHWEYFPCQMGEGVGTVVYDHGLSETIDDLPINQSVRFDLRFKSPNDAGLPDEAESEMAELLESRLEAELEKRSGIYSGRITYEG